MSVSAEAQWNGGVTRFITLTGAWLQRLKAAALERSRRGDSRHMVLLESLSLGNRRQLFLVSCDEHRFLVGAGPDRVGTVVAMPEPTPDAAPPHTASQQPQAAKAPAAYQRPEWRRDRSMGASGLQLVKRESASQAETNRDCSVEAGRSQWM